MGWRRQSRNFIQKEQVFAYELASTSQKKRFKHAVLYTAALAVVGALSLWGGFETARRTLAAPSSPNAERANLHEAQLESPVLPASPARLPAASSESGDAEFNHLTIQQRAERLLERAMDDDQRSLDLLRQNVDGWRGQFKSTERLFELVLAALNSPKLPVRTAAIDVDLAANNLSKTSDSVTRLLREMQSNPGAIGMSLWRLGALGNRGVEPEKVLNTLLVYARSRNEHTRYWAVEGLSMLGNDMTVDPLLQTMAHDASPKVRELAANSLAHAGMLTHEQRLGAVPELLNFADDDSLEAGTRELVYGTLRVITGAELGNDMEAWREWWANHDPTRERPRNPLHIVRT
jgi:HEAT repeats